MASIFRKIDAMLSFSTTDEAVLAKILILFSVFFYFQYPSGGNTSSPGKLDAGSEISVPARDLIGRLLQPEPTKRLRSLLTLKTIPFFMGFNFDDTKAKKVSPKDILKKYFPESPLAEMISSEVVFLDFEISPTLV